MSIGNLSAADVEIIRQCLRAATDGPYFPDWEFSTLFGLTREEVSAVARSWPNVDDGNSAVSIAVNNALGNLVGYPHGKDLSAFVDATPSQLLEVLKRWRAAEKS